MTDPISVLLIIGQLYLGPFTATKAELAEWAAVRANTVIERDEMRISYRQKTEPCPGDCHAMANSDWQMLCRRAMTQIGIGWRMGLLGEVGWMTSAARGLAGIGKYESIEVRCVETDAAFRSKRYDSGYGDEVKPGVFSR